MKIRRILATAVAAAVTTPVVFLSAAPAFADTKPSPSSTQKPATTQDDPDEDMPSLEELRAAVALAQKEYDEAVLDLAKAEDDLKALDKADNPLKAAVTDAQKAADEAAAKKTAADEAVAKAEKAVTELPADATDEQKKAAADAVTAAKTAADEAAAVKTAADEKLKKATADLAAAKAAADRVVKLAEKVKKTAAEKLDAAKEELAFFEEIGEECEVDSAVKIALSGPKSVTAGEPAVFSLRVTNTSDQTLDSVHAFANALRLPAPGEEIDEETDFAKHVIPIEWSSDDVLEWTEFTEKFDSIEVGKLAKGASYDVKLRLTVDAEAAAGKGVIFGYSEYENNDGSCGVGEDYKDLNFDILAKGDKPKPTETATPTPAPTVTTGGNTQTTQQGGSSNTPVNGTLAATGANDTLPLGLAAAGAVALGAGALVVARRRKAGAQA
ncbi:LPXTG cell wall anchor domain-containing protein [Streptomyces tanashiensis]|uniref:LPXTG cell wall anchor domain-containing protein n=2 Tax=Streptomyces tanashiensis TaxID=67367 RepID=A0ABY6QX25_9ACTN|nr:LPXTG cell wall anchor domain-containing protein [Streptomyces tanashiensis]UZX22350.1 LPXTG cell wall anchor domain-containing protein [Streptomyces tanashiensis]